MEERAQAAQEPQAASLESGFRWREHVVDMREKLGPGLKLKLPGSDQPQAAYWLTHHPAEVSRSLLSNQIRGIFRGYDRQISYPPGQQNAFDVPECG